ncbi:LysR family transcriptional regulator [Paenibacillus catalpae]|uniref:LysR family transcriptional regulator n=1 Tax=Paenibacillus catalpae TaxID=1045775 RepID=UPI000B04E1F7
MTLFERSGRNLVLNRYGRLFLERAKLVVMQIEKSKQEIANLINPSTGIISLCFLHMLGAKLIPSLLGSFRERYADVRFELHQSSNHELMTLVSKSSISLEELQEEPYIGLKSSCGLSFTINKLFETTQIQPKPYFR